MQRHVVEGGDGEDDAGVAWVDVVSIESLLFEAMVPVQTVGGRLGGRKSQAKKVHDGV